MPAESNDLFLEAVNNAVVIEEPADAANVLLQITTALFDVGNTDYANALLQKTFRRIKELEDPKERAYLLRLFVTLLCRQGLIAAAAETLPLLDDPEQRDIALKELAMAQAAAGRQNDALATAEELEDLDDYEKVLAAIGKHQVPAESGKAVIPIETAREIDDLFHRGAALRQVGISMYASGKKTEARTVFKETLNTIQRISNSYSRANALTDFASGLVSIGFDDSAVKVFRLGASAALEIDDISFALSCFCKIVESQAEARLFGEAFDTIKIIEELREEIPRKSPWGCSFDRDLAVVLGKLAAALADSPEEEKSAPLFQRALDIARSIVDAQCRAVALMRLASCLR